MSIEEVYEWYTAHFDQYFNNRNFLSGCFATLESAQDGGYNCRLISSDLESDSDSDGEDGKEIPSQALRLQVLRCDSYFAIQRADNIDTQNMTIDEGAAGDFMNTDLVLTKRNEILDALGGLEIEDGKLKYKEWATEDFDVSKYM